MRFLSVILCLLIASLAMAAPPPSQRVGQPITLTDIYIPGGEAKPAPRRDREPPLVVRLLEIKPAQDGHRYDFEVQGLAAGTYDLAKFLVAADPSAPPNFPQIPIEITTALPVGIPLPHELPPAKLPSLGGYRNTMLIIAGVWLAVLIAIILWKKKSNISTTAQAPAPTLAERLRPLIDEAATGKMDSAGRAKLERLILGHWRERLPEIAGISPADAMVKLRQHREASPLILALERWLHARDAETSAAEIEKLLAPYR